MLTCILKMYKAEIREPKLPMNYLYSKDKCQHIHMCLHVCVYLCVCMKYCIKYTYKNIHTHPSEFFPM